jgi:hypothetical protein
MVKPGAAEAVIIGGGLTVLELAPALSDMFESQLHLRCCKLAEFHFLSA